MKLEFSSPDWNSRFSVQARWTKSLRDFLIEQTGIQKSSCILEVGSGTGVILRDITQQIGNDATGIDINFHRLSENKHINLEQVVSCADVYNLPFFKETFDFVISHYFFLWLDKPIQALEEIERVLKPGGSVIAFAEPDYAARVEHPQLFAYLGSLQTDSLIKQGISPIAGRSLPKYLSDAGFSDIQFGVSGFQISMRQIPSDWESEWEMLQHDLSEKVSLKELLEYKSKDKDARLSGTRVSWIPTFYAIGRKN